MNERQAKLQVLKNKRAKQTKQAKANEQSHKELLASIDSLQGNISTLEQSLSQNGTAYTKSQKDLAQNFKTLREILENGLNVTNIKDIKQAKEIIVSNLKDIPKPVVNTTKTEIPKWLASEKSVKTLNNSVMKVVQALIDLEANIKPKQTTDEFVPMRRVVRRGNKLEFDDSYWGGSGGGGSSGSSNGLTDAQLRATPVDVTLTTGDIEIGAVELKNGTDDTRATVTAGNALKVDGSAVTQPVSGTVTANLSATDNAVLDQIELNTDFGTVTGGGTETGAVRVTIANNSTGVLSVDDNGNSLTVDGTVTANLSATDNAVLDNIDANTTPTTGLNTGRKVVTTAGTAVALASSTTCKWVAVTAETDNTSTVVVGDSGVIASLSTREGVPLGAGDSIVIPIDNLADVYIDSLVSGEGVTFLYGT